MLSKYGDFNGKYKLKTINKSYYQIITIFFIGLFSIILNSCGGSGGTTATVYPILLPTVTMLSPTDNAINVSRDPNIQLQFSETMNVATIINANIMLQTIAGVNVPISAIASGDNNQFTFSPTNALTENTQYQVIITTGVTDIRGNSLATNQAFSFTTGAVIVPTVTMLNPADNAINVSRDPNI